MVLPKHRPSLLMIINDTEFKKFGQLGFIEKIVAEEIEKNNKPVWRLLISLKDAEQVAQLYTQRNIERTFSHPITILSYVRKCFAGDTEITFKLKKDLENLYATGQE